MTKHYCDKCGKEMPLGMKSNVKIGLWQHHRPDIDTITGERSAGYDDYKVFHYDLCNDCAGEITKVISGTNEAKTVVFD